MNRRKTVHHGRGKADDGLIERDGLVERAAVHGMVRIDVHGMHVARVEGGIGESSTWWSRCQGKVSRDWGGG